MFEVLDDLAGGPFPVPPRLQIDQTGSRVGATTFGEDFISGKRRNRSHFVELLGDLLFPGAAIIIGVRGVCITVAPPRLEFLRGLNPEASAGWHAFTAQPGKHVFGTCSRRRCGESMAPAEKRYS